MEIFTNIINAFTVTFYPFNVSLLLNFFTQKPQPLNCSVWLLLN